MPEPRASTLAGRKRHWIPSRTNLCGIMLYTEHKIYLSQNSPGWPVWADRRCISTSDYWRVTEQRKEKIHDLRVEHFYSSPPKKLPRLIDKASTQLSEQTQNIRSKWSKRSRFEATVSKWTVTVNENVTETVKDIDTGNAQHYTWAEGLFGGRIK